MKQALRTTGSVTRSGTMANVNRSVAAPAAAIPLGPGSRRHCPDPCRGRRKTLEDLLRKQSLSATKLRYLWSHPAGLLRRELP